MATASGSALARTLVLPSSPRPCPPHPSSNVLIHAAATDIDYPEHPGLLSLMTVDRWSNWLIYWMLRGRAAGRVQ